MDEVAREVAEFGVQEAVGEAELDDVVGDKLCALGARVGARGGVGGVGCISLWGGVIGARGLGHAFWFGFGFWVLGFWVLGFGFLGLFCCGFVWFENRTPLLRGEAFCGGGLVEAGFLWRPFLWGGT